MTVWEKIVRARDVNPEPRCGPRLAEVGAGAPLTLRRSLILIITYVYHPDWRNLQKDVRRFVVGGAAIWLPAVGSCRRWSCRRGGVLLAVVLLAVPVACWRSCWCDNWRCGGWRLDVWWCVAGGGPADGVMVIGATAGGATAGSATTGGVTAQGAGGV